jgi:MYXO-CTERM domain-containing protein
VKRRFLRTTLLVTLLSTPELASASETFPPRIRHIYRLERDPECTLCHSTIEGGEDTITTRFGKNMERRGVRGKIPGSLDPALIAAAEEQQDSDGDEATDYYELRSGTDPNDDGDVPELGAGGGGGGEEFDPGEIPDLPPLAEHGCAVARPSGDSGVASLALLLVWALRRRRRATRA